MACFYQHSEKIAHKWSFQLVQSLRFGSSWKRKVLKREFDDTVFQYAGENAKRADRLYGWGCTATGALGMKILNIIILFYFALKLEHLFQCVTVLSVSDGSMCIYLKQGLI